mmetsp:Transcript_56519/g.126136  ORF Transcript_56519/g.126136 Transcript_56519/m.126136 type:complete len:80 (-) Transcript_56519:170-409(-)
MQFGWEVSLAALVLQLRDVLLLEALNLVKKPLGNDEAWHLEHRDSVWLPAFGSNQSQDVRASMLAPNRQVPFLADLAEV